MGNVMIVSYSGSHFRYVQTSGVNVFHDALQTVSSFFPWIRHVVVLIKTVFVASALSSLSIRLESIAWCQN